MRNSLYNSRVNNIREKKIRIIILSRDLAVRSKDKNVLFFALVNLAAQLP